MKKITLLLAIAMVFSCSKDNVTTETQTTNADLTQMTPNKALDTSSEGLYYGVFGHNSNSDLHGKVFINAGNDGNYYAQIDLKSGNKLIFDGNSLNTTNIHFVGDRGSFDFNIADFNAPVASNVMIDQESESYIIARKSTSRGIGIVILGAYEETGNEDGFYGNWDLFALEPPTTGPDARGGGGGLVIDAVVVSHKGNRGPFVDGLMEPYDYCLGMGLTPFLVPIDSFFDVWCDGQSSILAGHEAIWNLKFIPGFHGDFGMPYSPLDDCIPAPFGTWTWAGRSGVIIIEDPLPIPPPDFTDTNDRAMHPAYARFK